MAQPFFYYLSSFATLEVDDLDGATRWYREALGFHVLTQVPAENGSAALVHLSRGEDQDLVLVAGKRGAGTSSPVLHFAVDSSLDELAHRAEAAGAQIVERSRRTDRAPASMRLRDPQGYELAFYKRVVPRPG